MDTVKGYPVVIPDAGIPQGIFFDTGGIPWGCMDSSSVPEGRSDSGSARHLQMRGHMTPRPRVMCSMKHCLGKPAQQRRAILRQIHLLLLIAGSIFAGASISASDLERAQHAHERLWTDHLKTYPSTRRLHPNTAAEVLTSLDISGLLPPPGSQERITVPADLAPLFQRFSYLELGGELQGIKQVAHLMENTTLVFSVFFRSDRTIRIQGALFAGWSGEQNEILELKGEGELTNLRLVSLEGIPRDFDAVELALPGSDLPIQAFSLQIDPQVRLSIGGERFFCPERFRRLYMSPGRPDNGSAALTHDLEMRGFLPGRQMTKLADELETKHGRYTPPLLSENLDRPGYADHQFFTLRKTDRFKQVPADLKFAHCFNIWPSYMKADLGPVANERGTPALEHFDAAADLVTAYLRDELKDSGRTATWWEVKNESDVPSEWSYHEVRGVDSWGYLAAFHRKIAQAVRLAAPGARVGGPASAWPRFEMGVPWFSVWENHRRFMEETAEDLDFYSHHFYEVDDPFTFGSRQKEYDGWFQGRVENVLDMLQAYMQHSGNAKPLLITEYGSLSGGLQEKDYWLRVSILSSFLMRFLARPDEIQLAVPFLLGYMHWEPGSGSALIHKSPTGEFYYTRNIFFIQLWEDVGGEYVFVNSPDPKVHVQAWAENARLWVAVNNHSGNRLSMFPHAFLTEDSSRALKSVHVRHPAYQEGEFKFIQKRLGPEEAYLLPVSDTLLFCFEFEQEPVARCHLLKQSFYADRIGHRLENGQQAAFHIRLSDDIPLAELECVVIRLGLLDGMGRGIAPELSFNGRTLAMPFALPTAVSFEHLRIEASPGQVLQDNVLQVRVPEEGDPIGISHVALELYYRHEQ